MASKRPSQADQGALTPKNCLTSSHDESSPSGPKTPTQAPSKEVNLDFMEKLIEGLRAIKANRNIKAKRERFELLAKILKEEKEIVMKESQEELDFVNSRMTVASTAYKAAQEAGQVIVAERSCKLRIIWDLYNSMDDELEDLDLQNSELENDLDRA